MAESLINTKIELIHGPKMCGVLDAIGWYARTYDLTPEQVEKAFDAGVAAAVAMGLFTIDSTRKHPMIEKIFANIGMESEHPVRTVRP